MNPHTHSSPAASSLPPRKLVEHALRLIGRQHKADAGTAHAAHEQLRRWLQQDPAHAAAARMAQRLWDISDGSSLRDSTPLPPGTSADPQRIHRRQLLGLVGVGGLAAALAGRWYWRQPVLELALRTGQAQLLARSLPDGSQLDLAANTAARVVYHRGRRTVYLDAGEIRFQVAHDAERPFSVLTDWGRVRVLGTTFSVAARDGRMAVAVAEGRVAVWAGAASPDELDTPATVLGAGEAVQTEGDTLGPRSAVRSQDVGAWSQGWLVFDNTPLPQAVARWNDYLRQPLQLEPDPALSALRLSGSFPLRNPQAFLAGLPDMLPLRLSTAGDGSVRVGLRR